MAKRRVLVVGAGIAGTSLSTFLAKAGHDVTVIERSPSFQARGHILAVKGVGVEILQSLGALDQAKAHELPARSLDIFTGAGRFLRHVENKELDDTLGGYLLLRRAHLQQALYDRRDPSVTFSFGMQADQLVRSASGVDVAFSDGGTDRFDLVFGCDGVWSQVRTTLFDDIPTASMNAHYAVFVTRTPRGWPHADECFFMDVGRTVAVFPMPNGQIGIVIYQDDQHPAPPMKGSAAAWRDYLVRTGDGLATEIRDVFAGISDEDEVFDDRVTMVSASRAVSGRIALVGDAGYCPTFFSGMGASLALQGAYLLAKALASNDDDAAALTHYESRIIPIARSYQKNARGMRNSILSRSQIVRILRSAIVQMAPASLMAAETRRFYKADQRMADLG